MRNILALLLTLLFPALLVAQTGPTNQPLVLTHVTVIDMTGAQPKPDMTVVIAGNRIAALGKTSEVLVPQNARLVDARGKFLIPGLWDMHTHTNWNRRAVEVEERFFPLFIANGVTGIREMGSLFSIERFNRWRAASAAGNLLAPRIIVGKMVAGPDDSSLAITVRNEREAREAVRRVKREGYDFVKVHGKLSRESLLAIADEASRQDIPFVGHVPADMNPGEASDAGMRSIEHLSGMITAASTNEEELRKEELDFGRRFAGLKGRALLLESVRLDNRLFDTYSEAKAARLFQRFVRNNTWHCPTLVIHRPFALVTDPSIYNDPRFRYISADRRRRDAPYWDDLRSRPAEQIAAWDRNYRLRLRQVGAAHRAGVQLLAGTDTCSMGSSYPIAGFSLHDELALFVQAGLTPLEALRTATYNPAKYLGLLDSLGTIEQGKLADLVLLDANPLENITNTQRINSVIVNGRYFPKERLQEILNHIEATANER